MVSVARMWLAVLLAVAPADAARAYSLLSYVGGDYASAVGPRGEVISRQELDEQSAFATDAAEGLRAAGAADLAEQADCLRSRIVALAAPPEVMALARALAARVAARFKLAMIPERAPDLRRGNELYLQACAACHGADGSPRVGQLELTTQPTAFSSRQQVARLSPQRIFSAISFGRRASEQDLVHGAENDTPLVHDLSSPDALVLLQGNLAELVREGEP